MPKEPSTSAAKKKVRQTAFPLSRIKKIMQMDEEVGKVAGGTPVGVSKALELFLADLVRQCVTEASNNKSKRIMPSHLKATINHVEHFDFLRELVADIPDTVPQQEEEDGGKKKRGAGGGRKKGKKKDDDEEMDDE
ncbi:histone-fold-containing protein [Atractiella rhizophila]|nr:histone-fold-containing protein [Atractiella rhizophila]